MNIIHTLYFDVCEIMGYKNDSISDGEIKIQNIFGLNEFLSIKDDLQVYEERSCITVEFKEGSKFPYSTTRYTMKKIRELIMDLIKVHVFQILD